MRAFGLIGRLMSGRGLVWGVRAGLSGHRVSFQPVLAARSTRRGPDLGALEERFDAPQDED